MMLSQEHSMLLWVTVAVAAARTKGKDKRYLSEAEFLIPPRFYYKVNILQ